MSTVLRERTVGDLAGDARAMVEMGLYWSFRVTDPPFVWAEVVPRRRGRALTRAGWLTPYIVETIADDARRAGAGARLDIRVAPGPGPGGAASVAHLFAPLARHGVEVRVR
jgi:hypothetical protein